MFEAFAIRKEKWQEHVSNIKKGMISYLNYPAAVCKQRVGLHIALLSLIILENLEMQ